MHEFNVRDFHKLAAVVTALQEEVSRLGERLTYHTHDRLVEDDSPKLATTEQAYQQYDDPRPPRF